MRYMVYFNDDINTLYFNTLEEADHYARLNAGTVEDTETGDIICIYTDTEE